MKRAVKVVALAVAVYAVDTKSGRERLTRSGAYSGPPPTDGGL